MVGWRSLFWILALRLLMYRRPAMVLFRSTVSSLSFLLPAIVMHLVHPVCGYASGLLPSWNEGSAKTAIIEFVEKVTTEGTEGYVVPEERVAVFDNDGTLWPENPIPFQMAYALDQLKRLAPNHPEWRKDPLLAAALDADMATIRGQLKEVVESVMAKTHAGMTTEEFNRLVRDWMARAKHPRFRRPYAELGYQPMQEVIDYLRSNGFRVYIVSGGGADFMRVWCEQVYGIPPEQAVGSIGAVRFEMRDGIPVLIKEPKLEFVNDKDGKPIAIHRQIGRRPLAAFGNSDGDEAMLKWTTVGRSPSLGLIVHHTDAQREYAYDENPQSSGRLKTALAAAKKRGWIVVDMEKDWNQLFAKPSP